VNFVPIATGKDDKIYLSEQENKLVSKQLASAISLILQHVSIS
jgi:hypothetical protein